MTEWVFWGDRRISGVYENIYLRTFVEDWFNIVNVLAKEIKGKLILDVGCGEGHTTKQILNKLKIDYLCDIMEPNREALEIAKKFLSFENKLGDGYLSTIASFKTPKKYDTVFTSHTNYYWSDNELEFRKQLDKIFSLVKAGGKLMILTLPSGSDHYNIMLKQIYPEFNYSNFIVDYYKNKKLNVKTIRFKMRMVVGDMLDNNGNLYDIINFYKFIHNTDSTPNKDEALSFLEKIEKYQKNGYLDFKDELIIVSNN